MDIYVEQEAERIDEELDALMRETGIHDHEELCDFLSTYINIHKG